MGTKSSVYYGTDDDGTVCHIYWELAERIVEKGRMIAAPIFISFEHSEAPDRDPIRLTPEVARLICGALGKPPDVEII